MKLNWGTGLIIFFLIFFVWVFSFVFFAMRQNNDLVSDDYYQQGAKYTDQININRRSAAYQDSLQMTLSEKKIRIAFCRGLAGRVDSVQVYFFRSSDKSKDHRFGFEKSDSALVIDKEILLHGRYQVYISWQNHGEKFMVKKFLDVN